MPLTPAQTSLHWKRWAAVVHANDWRMDRGRLHPGARHTRDATLFHKLVWREAEREALQQHGAVTADHLRHGSYAVATTNVPAWPRSVLPVRSLADLGNRTFSRVLVLWALLVDEDDLDAQIKWDHPDISERESLIKAISRRAPDATLRAISARAFDTRAWEMLEDVGQLRWLLRTVCEKQARHRRPLAPAEQPF